MIKKILLMLFAATIGCASVVSADWELGSGIQAMYKFDSTQNVTESSVPLGLTYRPDVVSEDGTTRPSKIPIFVAYNFGVDDDTPSSQWFGAGWSFRTWEGYELIGEGDLVLEGSSNEKLVGGMAGIRATATVAGQPFLVRLLGGWIGQPAMALSITFTSGKSPEAEKKEDTIAEWQ